MGDVFEVIGMITVTLISIALFMTWCESISWKIKNRKVVCEHCNKKHSKKYSINVKGFNFCNEICLIDYCKKL